MVVWLFYWPEWCHEYSLRYPNPQLLQTEVDTFMEKFDKDQDKVFCPSYCIWTLFADPYGTFIKTSSTFVQLTASTIYVSVCLSLSFSFSLYWRRNFCCSGKVESGKKLLFCLGLCTNHVTFRIPRLRRSESECSPCSPRETQADEYEVTVPAFPRAWGHGGMGAGWGCFKWLVH